MQDDPLGGRVMPEGTLAASQVDLVSGSCKRTDDALHFKSRPICKSASDSFPGLIPRALDCVAMQMRGVVHPLPKPTR